MPLTASEKIEQLANNISYLIPKNNVCPACKITILHPTPARNSRSRKDNKTYICNDCGLIEALNDFREKLS